MPTTTTASPELDAVAARTRTVASAILTGQPLVGMTRSELNRAMRSLPDKVNAAQYGAIRNDQLIYYRDDRTIYVYTENDIVTAIQNTEGGAPKALSGPQTAARPCPSAREIRDIEIEMSKFANRGNDRLLTELQKQLREARECGR